MQPHAVGATVMCEHRSRTISRSFSGRSRPTAPSNSSNDLMKSARIFAWLMKTKSNKPVQNGPVLAS